MLIRYLFRATLGALLLLLLLPIAGRGQGATPPDKSYDYVEVMPEYPGGQGALLQAVPRNVKYPPQALRSRVRGKVYVKFVVDETGRVINPAVARGIGSGCDAEAVRVVGQLERFTPGLQNGKPVKVYFMLPINFSISGMNTGKASPSYDGDSGVVYTKPERPAHQRGVMPAQEADLFSQPALTPGARQVVGVQFVLDHAGRFGLHHEGFPINEDEVRQMDISAQDKEAILTARRLVAASGNWVPARQGGVAVASEATHYVLFGVERRADVFYAPDEPAEYPGGPNALAEWVRQALSYPAAARKAKRDGTAYVRVVIDPKGRVTEPEIITGPGGDLDAEALRVVQSLRRFRPARHAGQPVASYRIVPVAFSLSGQ